MLSISRQEVCYKSLANLLEPLITSISGGRVEAKTYDIMDDFHNSLAYHNPLSQQLYSYLVRTNPLRLNSIFDEIVSERNLR